MRTLRFAALAALLVPAMAAAVSLPAKPARGRVLDGAGVLAPLGIERLQEVSDDLERRTGAELVVATVASLEGLEVEDYANRLFKAWGVGKKGKNNGVLILLAPRERKARIEAGYGLESVLPDIVAGRILKDEAHASFHDRRWQEGLLVAARRVSAVVSGDAPAAAPAASRWRDPTPTDWPLVIGFAFFSLIGGLLLGASIPALRLVMVIPGAFGALFLGMPLFLGWAVFDALGFAVVAGAGAAAFLWGLFHPFRYSGVGETPNWLGRAEDGSWAGSSSSSSSYDGGSSGSSDSGSSGGGDFGGGDSGGGGASDSF